MKQLRNMARAAGVSLGLFALAGLMMTASAPKARADDDHDKCRHAIEKAQHRLDHAVEKYGEHSPQAEHYRHALNDEREHCWQRYHGYWSSQDNRWHDQRDWDDHDRDDHH